MSAYLFFPYVILHHVYLPYCTHLAWFHIKAIYINSCLCKIMDTPAVFVSVNSPEESFRETIKIGVDVTHHIPVTSAIFPASVIVMRLAQHGEAIRGIQEHLLEVPVHAELRTLRDRLDVAEAERATLRATVRLMGAVETSLRNHMRDERQTRIETESHLALV
nr:hypothetical protein [Tanacetum cinerariifolium]